MHVLHLGGDALPHTHNAVEHARLKCLGLAAVLMAAVDAMAPDLVVKLAEAVRLAPGWVRMDDRTRECFFQRGEAGRYVYTEQQILEMARRARQQPPAPV